MSDHTAIEWTVPLRLVIDEATVREYHEEYVGDVEWYRDHGQLIPDHPDPGYATGVPVPFSEYAEGLKAGVVADVLVADGVCYCVEAVTVGAA